MPADIPAKCSPLWASEPSLYLEEATETLLQRTAELRGLCKRPAAEAKAWLQAKQEESALLDAVLLRMTRVSTAVPRRPPPRARDRCLHLPCPSDLAAPTRARARLERRAH